MLQKFYCIFTDKKGFFLKKMPYSFHLTNSAIYTAFNHKWEISFTNDSHILYTSFKTENMDMCKKL